MRGLRDKRVLISGGSSGIGKAAAQRFLEEGALVFFCGLDADEVDAAAAELGEFGAVSGIPADVSREAHVTRLVELGTRDARWHRRPDQQRRDRVAGALSQDYPVSLGPDHHG